MRFVNLHAHSYFSMLDGLTSIEQIVDWHVEQGESHAAICDHGGIGSGVFQFYQRCIEKDINPVIGAELYFSTAPYLGCRELGQDERKRQFHMTVFCKNNTGYRNLLKLSTIANTEGMYYRPTIIWDTFREHKEGLIVLSGCPSAVVPRLLRDDRYDEAKQEAKRWRDLLGEDYYIELMYHPTNGVPDYLAKHLPVERIEQEQKEFREMQDKIFYGLLDIAKELSIPTVSTNDSHYACREDAELHDIAYAMGQGKKIDDPERRFFPCPEFYMKTGEEMKAIFPEDEKPDVWDESIERTVEVAEKCYVRLDELVYERSFDDEGEVEHKWRPKEFLLPTISDVPDGMTSFEYLHQLCRKGMDELGYTGKEEYESRLKHELEVINTLGWSDYFCLLYDVVKFCHDNGIPVGPRGSASGALVVHILGVSDQDPIEHELLFERFLSLARADMPDVDLDISKERRKEVIDYIVSKYGQEHVALISTTGKMGAKAAIKKVATCFSLPFEIANELTSHIKVPQGEDISVDDAMRIKEIKAMYDKDEQVRYILDLARKFNGMPQFEGVHPAGVVISPRPLRDMFALREADGYPVVTWDMDEVSKTGVVKLDVLGLRNLTVLERTIEEIKRNRGQEVTLDSIPMDDLDTYKLMSTADVTGVFQLGSNLARQYLLKMKPKTFAEVEAFVALIRPGSLDAPSPNGDGTMVDEYIRRMYGESPSVPPHPLIGDILRNTQNVIVYQESIMQITQAMAGFTGEEANEFREVVGKKRVKQMPAQKEKFIRGCIKNGIPKEEAERVMALLETFARYGFNKCLSGDTVVYRSSPSRHQERELTIKELYDNWNSNTPTGRRYRHQGVKLLGLVEGRVRPVRVAGIWKTGVKPVYEVKTKSGKSIKATLEHQFLTSEGWRQLQEISVGSILYRMGECERECKEGGGHKWDEGYPVHEDPIVSIRYHGEEETYDMEIDKYHNFIANGIVTHNSHANRYAKVAIQTAFLRAHYFSEFMAAHLSTLTDDREKLHEYLVDCHNHGVRVLPPDINTSTNRFIADGEDIRFGLTATKGIGDKAYEEIVSDRERNGPYRSFLDFFNRVYGGAVNKSTLEALIQCGAFDKIEPNRTKLFVALPQMLKAMNSYKGKIKRIEDRYLTIGEWSDIRKVEKEREKLEERRQKAKEELDRLIEEALNNDAIDESRVLADWEKEILGYYAAHHPLDEYRDYTISLSQLPKPVLNSSNIKELKDEDVVSVAMVADVKTRFGSAGKRLEVTFEDWHGTFTGTAWGQKVFTLQDVLSPGEIVHIEGRVTHWAQADVWNLRIDVAKKCPREPLPPKLIVYVDPTQHAKVATVLNRLTFSDAELPVVVRSEGRRDINLPKKASVKDINLINGQDGVFFAVVA